MGLFNIYLRGHRYKFPKNHALQSLKIAFILANNAGPDEMTHFVAFHLGLHCLPKNPFRGFEHTKLKKCLKEGI